MNHFETWNPYTEEKLDLYKYSSPREIVLKIEKLSTSFDIWKNMSVSQRLIWLENFRNNLKASVPELSLLITQTMGKPLVDAKLEVEKCLTQFDYYIEKGPELILETSLTAHYPDARVRFLPMGIVFSIMPWNYPVWQFFRFSVGAWLAGNVVLLKHSEVTTSVALFLEKLVEKTQGPALLQTVILDPKDSEIIFANKQIRAITFTGSSRIGRTIGELAGRYLKKCVLELGGNDAFVVDDTASLDKAISLAASGRLINNGQSCISSKRFFLPKGKVIDFMNGINEEIKKFPIGDPMERTTRLGPLAQKRFREENHEHVRFLKSVSALSTEPASFPEKNGYFVSPYFFYLENRKKQKESEMYRFFQQQEVFSPVGMVMSYDSEDELYSLVNDSPYGLGAVWVGDSEKFKKENLHLKFDVGMIAVNDTLKSDARVPFGGVKDSGYGRESGEFGIREFCNTQSLGIR